jgi:protein phosphatase 1 regulatory subunit 7
MKQERIQNPASVERAAIEAKIAEGKHVTLQFDQPCYTAELLRKINNLCGEFGKQLTVRFYGHYGNHFDASVLRSLPDVVSLSVDCLSEAAGLSGLGGLANLRCLSLGICNLDDPDILKSLPLQNLETLAISESLKANFDLAPLQACNSLVELHVEKHTKNMGSLAKLPMLRTLSLRGIPKKQSLGFVSEIRPLRRLEIVIGGRTDISDVQHPLLEELEIIRVLGFSNVDNLGAFPALRSFRIEDQTRLENVHFTAANKNIQSLKILNCKTLRNLEGLHHLAELKSIFIGMTALDIDSILQQQLPTSLKVFGFYTGKKKENAKIREKLDALGYRES